MSVPIQSNFLALLIDDAAHKLHDFARAVRCCMANGVADANRTRAATNRRGVKRANCFGIGARCVFGDEHDWQPFVNGKRHRFFRHLQQLIQGPFLSIETNRRRADERASFDRNARALRNFGNRNDVVLMRARGAVGTDLQIFGGDLAGHQLDARRVSAARAG